MQRRHPILTPVDFACACRAAGNAQFRGGHQWRALHRYELALEVIGRGKSKNAEQEPTERDETYQTLRRDVLLNIAACALPLELWRKAEYVCTAAMDIDKGNHKALLRRSRALAAVQRFEEARADLRELVRLDPENATARIELSEVGKSLGKQVKAQREFSSDFWSGYVDGDGYGAAELPVKEDSESESTDEFEEDLKEIHRRMREHGEENERLVQQQMKLSQRIENGEDPEEVMADAVHGPMLPEGAERGGVIKRKKKPPKEKKEKRPPLYCRER